jgi:hypothetical protein
MRSAILEVVVVRDLLDEMNDVPPELRLVDAHERFGERKSVRRGEEVRHVGWPRWTRWFFVHPASVR